MTWKPSKIELELIADAGYAGQPVEKIACALGITEAEFRAWSASLVATRTTPPPPPPPSPRVIADRVFETQPAATEGIESEEV